MYIFEGILHYCTIYMLISLITVLTLTFTNAQHFDTVCWPSPDGLNATRIPRCGYQPNICTRMTISKTPGPGGAPSPYPCAEGVCVNPARLDPSPMIFEEVIEYKMEYLRRFRWDVYCPRYNWFFNPKNNPGETPCHQFKLQFSGIDVTVFSPESPIAVCSTLKNYEDLTGFLVMNANNCTGINSENYLLTQRRLAYALNLVSGCGQLRTVVLSKLLDEFPVGYSYRLVNNPLRCRRPKCPGNCEITVKEVDRPVIPFPRPIQPIKP